MDSTALSVGPVKYLGLCRSPSRANPTGVLEETGVAQNYDTAGDYPIAVSFRQTTATLLIDAGPATQDRTRSMSRCRSV